MPQSSHRTPLHIHGSRADTHFIRARPQLVAFVVGFYTQNIQNTLWLGLGGSMLAFVAIVPPWPYMNRAPARWLQKEGVAQGQTISVAAS